MPHNCIGKETITTEDREITRYFNELATRVASRFDVRLINPIDRSRKKNYCLHPWSHISIDPDGNMSPCCNIARNERFGKFTGRDSWNSDILVKARQAFHNGRKPFKNCDFCWANQDPKARLCIKPRKP